MINIFRGYVRTQNKRCIDKFNYKDGHKLKTFEQIKNLPEFAGILNGEWTVIDIDERTQAEKLYEIVISKNINCRVYETTRGKHFVFKSSPAIKQNHGGRFNAIGLKFDAKYGKNAYIMVKFNNKWRKPVREFDENKPIATVPMWLCSIGKEDPRLFELGDGDGRNNALFTHIGTLVRKGLDIADIKIALGIINKFIFAEELPTEELKRIARKETFENAKKYSPKADFQNENPFPFVIFNSQNKPSISPPLLAKHVRQQEHCILVRDDLSNQAQVFAYMDGVYKRFVPESFKGVIKKHIAEYSEPYARISSINETYNLLIADLDFIERDLLNAEEDIINFENGLYNIKTGELLPHTPKILSTIQIPCKWDNQITDTPVFDKYMKDLTNGNKEIAQLLLEFMGVCISNIKGSRLKKALFMVGAGDTGKSQLKSLTEKIVGKGNYTAIDLKELEARFGTSNIYGKRLAGSADMSFVSIDELKIFKRATGGDSIFAEFKGIDGFEFVFHGLLWFCMNKLPKFGGDNGDWVYDRIMAVRCDNVIPQDKQDKHLLDKLYQEREGIIKKVVLALKTVIDNNYNFSEPECVSLHRKEYQSSNSTVITFFEECMCERPNNKIEDKCTTGKVHKVYREWCKDNNNGYGRNNRDFQEELLSHLGMPASEEIVKRNYGWAYRNYTLTKEAKEMYPRAYGFNEFL